MVFVCSGTRSKKGLSQMISEYLLVTCMQQLFFLYILGLLPLHILPSIGSSLFFYATRTSKMHTLRCFIIRLILLTSLYPGRLKSCYYENGRIANEIPCDPAAGAGTYCKGIF